MEVEAVVEQGVAEPLELWFLKVVPLFVTAAAVGAVGVPPLESAAPAPVVVPPPAPPPFENLLNIP